MKKTVFDPNVQQYDLSSKIVAGLERISQAFKVLLWDKAKELGLSPIQIQLLIFIAYHKTDLNNVSFLAREFNVTKPTISDAVKVLNNKGLIKKEHSVIDSRSYSIFLTNKGNLVVKETETFSNPIKEIMDITTPQEKSIFFGVLSKLIFRLNKNEILTVQRTCFACKFYQEKNDKSYCKFLKKNLLVNEIRLDCPEYQSLPT